MDGSHTSLKCEWILFNSINRTYDCSRALPSRNTVSQLGIYLFIYLFLSGTIFIDFEEKEARITGMNIFFIAAKYFFFINIPF